MLMEDIEVEVYRSTVKIPAIFFVPATAMLSIYVLMYLFLNSNIFIEELEKNLNLYLPGTFSVEKIVTDPSLTTIRIIDPRIELEPNKPIVKGGSLVVGLNPLLLLVKRVQVSYAELENTYVHIDLDDENDLSLLAALGLVGEDDAPDDVSPFMPSISLYNLQTRDCHVVFDMEGLHFEIASVSIPNAEIDIVDGEAAVTVQQLSVDRIPFVFTSDLLALSPEWGDWTPVAEEVRIDNWSWLNEGFSVENVHFVLDGTVLDAEGVMNFPSDVPDDQSMNYRASGRLTAPYYSSAGQYFINDYTHLDVRRLDIATEGDRGDVEVSASFDFREIDGYGLQVTDAIGTFTLENQNVYLGPATAKVHGGTVEIASAFYDMYTGVFGTTATFENVNPEPVVRDFGFDYPWLDGTASGAFYAFGYIPYEREVADDLEFLGGFEDATRPIVTVRITEDSTFKRTVTDVLPGTSFRIGKGTTVWSQEDRVGVPYASISSELGDFSFRDFVLEYDSYSMERTLDNKMFRAVVETADIEPMVAYYGGSGVAGKLSLELTGEGLMNYPDVDFDLRLENPTINISPVAWSGSSVIAEGSLKSGTLSMTELSLNSENAGTASVIGSLRVLRNPSGVIDAEGEQTTDYLYPNTHPMDLQLEVVDLGIAGIAKAIGADLGLEGLASAKGRLTGTLEAPQGEIDVATSDAKAFQQPIKTGVATLQFGGDSFAIKAAKVDLGKAGRIRGDAEFIDDQVEFDLIARGLRLSQYEMLQEIVETDGTGSFEIRGKGPLTSPQVGGFVRFDDVAVQKRAVGDLALVVNSIDDVVHLSGALLPWVTVDAEIPFAEDQSYYARFGIDHVDLTDAVTELRELKFLTGSSATGTVELYVEKDLSRYQVLANLGELELRTLGKRFRNRGPVIVGLNEERLLQIQQAEIGTDGRYVAVQGGVFLDQSLIDLSVVGDLDLSLLDGMRVAFSDYFPESFLEADGLAAVDTTIKGPPDGIIAEGTIDFAQSEILLRDFSDPLVILSGRVDLERDAMRVPANNPIRGRILGGLFRVTGSMGLVAMSPSDLVAKVWTQNLSYRIPDVADFTFGTQLELRAPDFDRPDTWEISGDVQILDGLYYENFSIFQEQLTNRLLGTFTQKTEQYEASVVERFPQLEEIGWNVDITARDGFRIQNEIDRLGLDLELRVGVNLRNTIVKPNVTGDIDVVGGSVAFQGERFDVRNGSLSFSGDASNPFVDVVADAEVQNACRDPEISNEASQTMTLSGIADAGEQQTFNVILNVRGKFENLDIQFDSTPYADQRDILSLLLTGCTVDQLTASSASSPTLEVALGPVLGWIEGQVQDAVKVEEFTITPSVDRLKATVGDSITRRLSWRFQLDTGLTDSAGGQLGQLVYKLSDKWSAQLSESISDSALSEEQNFLIEFKLKYQLLLD